MILLDTTVLSMVLRRRLTPVTEETREAFRRLIRTDTPLAVPGIVLQEVLSGVKIEGQFVKLSAGLEAFTVVLATKQDHSAAASLFNACRTRGISASLVDCQIATQTISRNGQLWTLDKDFDDIARCSSLKLFAP